LRVLREVAVQGHGPRQRVADDEEVGEAELAGPLVRGAQAGKVLRAWGGGGGRWVEPSRVESS
jgi:hypothetical protein